MMEMCGDNRFEIIKKARKHILDATNIDTSPKEMEVLDTFLYRCWQMGWLERYDENRIVIQTLPKDVVLPMDGGNVMMSEETYDELLRLGNERQEGENELHRDESV